MSYGKSIIGIIFLALLGFLGLAIFYPVNAKPIEFAKGVIFEKDIDSVERYKNTKIKFYNPEVDWIPTKKINTSYQPIINGNAGMLVELGTGEILFESESNKRRPIASLVKIMTAIVALEHKTLDTKIYISRNSANIGENSMGISEGEIYTLEELLYGLFLQSGNDAAYAIAEGVAGKPERFIEWMNIKAIELGLEDTYFADPSGLNGDSYSTPSDLVRLTRYALKFEELKNIAKTAEYQSEQAYHRPIHLFNQTNLLETYPGVKGFKTGYTEEAGLCLITYADNKGKEVIGVVLGSQDRKGDMILMLDYGYNSLGIKIEHNLLD